MKLLYLVGISFLISGCMALQPSALFDEVSPNPEPEHIEDFYAINILKDNLNSEVWFTENVKCIEVENTTKAVYSGDGAIHLKWNKQEGGCDWIGMGIGWDGWASKDFSMVINKAAVQIKAYNGGNPIKSLPLAASFEDYGGKSAWIGFDSKYITTKPGDSWSTITLPIEDFGWDQFGADLSNVKQFIIQFEADGDVIFDELKVVPYKGIETKNVESVYTSNESINIDGNLEASEWQNVPLIMTTTDAIQVQGNADFLYIGGKVMDETPLQNSKTGDEVWNGDGVEIGISTNPEAFLKRKAMLFSDQHFCLVMGAEPFIWDWRKHKKIDVAGVKIVTVKSGSGYSFEAVIPYSYFEVGDLKSNTNYNLEVAVNKGTNAKRDEQFIWNSKSPEFGKKPATWGIINFIETE